MSTITKADFLAFADDCATAAGACGTTWSADALIAVLDDAPCRHAFTSLLNAAASGADTTAAQAALAAARERDARADRAFAASDKMSADAILASEIKRVGEVEGLTPDEAAEAVLARYPLTRQKYIDTH